MAVGGGIVGFISCRSVSVGSLNIGGEKIQSASQSFFIYFFS